MGDIFERCFEDTRFRSNLNIFESAIVATEED